MRNGSFPFWTNVQIMHFFDNPRPKPAWSRQPTPFEMLCSGTEPLTHLISSTYALLFPDCNPKDNWASQKWETELSVDLLDRDWEAIFSCIHKGTVNVHTQENAFKIFSRWYRTPLRLHAIYPSVSPLCWRCGAIGGHALNYNRSGKRSIASPTAFPHMT